MGGAVKSVGNFVSDAAKDFTSDPWSAVMFPYGVTKTAYNAATGQGAFDHSGEGSPSAPGAPTNGQPAYSSGPGIQPGVYQDQLSSLNMADQGAGEKYYDNNSSVWQSPSYGETNAQGIINQYAGGTPQGTNNTQGWFNKYSSSMPSIASDPGLAPYFNNAKDRASESINQAMASRGAYGSSAANDQISRAHTDLEGQRALKEADYNLARLGEQRAWEGLGGQLAGQADNNSLAQSANERDWQSMLAGLGLNASQFGLNRTNAGMDASSNAQNLQRSRGNDYFNQQLALGDRLSGLMTNTYNNAIGDDQAYQDKVSSGGIADANAGAAQEQQNAQNTMNYAKDAMGGYTWGKGNGWW